MANIFCNFAEEALFMLRNITDVLHANQNHIFLIILFIHFVCSQTRNAMFTVLPEHRRLT